MLNVTEGGDCMDNTMPQSINVYPGQTEYFDVDRGDGSFDYDCDGTEELFDTDTAECSWSWFTCDVNVTGWVGGAPSSCGDIGEYINDDDHCSNSLGIAGCGIDQGLYPYTQSCR